MLATRRTARRPVRSTCPAVAVDDPAAVVTHVLPLLYHVAIKIWSSVRLDGPGHGDAEVDELVNEGAIAVLLMLRKGQYDPAKGAFKTYAYRVAHNAMTRYALASHYGISVREHHRQTNGKERPRWHVPGEALRHAPDRKEEGERESVQRVEVILGKLPADDRALARVYLEENGNVSAVMRRTRTYRKRWKRVLRTAREV